MRTITLPLDIFDEILFVNHPHWFPDKYQSIKAYGDGGCIAMCRYEVGVLLKELDKEERRYKVFLYEKTHHAEVWPIKEWLDSNTYYYLSQEEVEKTRQEIFEREQRFQERRQKVDEVFNILNEYLPKSQAEFYANRIVDQGKYEEVKKILQIYAQE